MNPKESSDIESIKVDLRYIRRDLDVINVKLDSHFVSKEEFEPIKRIVYGMVGLILIGVVGAMMALIIQK